MDISTSEFHNGFLQWQFSNADQSEPDKADGRKAQAGGSFCFFWVSGIGISLNIPQTKEPDSVFCEFFSWCMPNLPYYLLLRLMVSECFI